MFFFNEQATNKYGSSESQEITVRVEDVNDQRPVCNPSHITVLLPSHSKVPVEVIDIRSVCTDGDLSPANGIRNFSLTGKSDCENGTFVHVDSLRNSLSHCVKLSVLIQQNKVNIQ